MNWYLSTAGAAVSNAVPWALRSGLRSLANPVSAIRTVVGTARSTAQFARPVFTTRSPVMTGRSTVREVAALDLPLDVAEPVASMHRVGRIVRSWRDEPAVPLSSAIAAVLNVLPPGVLGGILKHMDFLASNVPGSPVPLYIAGAEVLGYYPFAPTIGSAVNITLMSHTTHCCIGINADSAAVPDLPVLVDAMAEGYGEVLAVGTGAEDSVTVEVVLPTGTG